MPWFIGGLVIASVMGMVLPAVLKERNERARLTEIIDHSKQLHLALMDFNGDFGMYPSDELAKEVPAFAGLTGPRVLE